MAAYARFGDGVEVGEEVFKALARFAPDGVMNVLACDQHNSILKLLTQFFENAQAKGKSPDEYPAESSDADVTRACQIFARALGRVPNAALFNHLGFKSEGFRELLGAETMLIGRLEDTNFLTTSEGKGQIAHLAVQPEEIAGQVDGFKTLVKVDPAHREAWEKNLEWIQDIWQRARKLGKPLFNETLYTPGGASKRELAAGLPEALVKIARDFGAFGDFYKTQVPMLWLAGNGAAARVSSPEVIRKTTEAMAVVVDRPLLLLSAAVDFEQYAAQYGIVCDLVAGPMCGRAYFKDPFADPEVADWQALEAAIAQVAVPRMEQIKRLAAATSKPWWHKYAWMSPDARTALPESARKQLQPDLPRPGDRVRVTDAGY